MRHFVTLIEIRMHLIRVNPGHICHLLLIQIRLFSLSTNSLLHPKLETTGGVILNMETIC